MGDRAVVVPLDDPDGRGAMLVATLDDRGPVDAVVAVDDQGVLVAATAARAARPPPQPARRGGGAPATRRAMRRALGGGEVPQPRVRGRRRRERLARRRLPVRREAGRRCPASQGVIRADDPAAARRGRAAGPRRSRATGRSSSRSTSPASRSRSRACSATARSRCSRSSTSPTRSTARTSRRRSTSRRRASRDPTLARVARVTARRGRRARARRGPGPRRAARRRRPRSWVIEVAARSIGGLCARALRFGAGISLEEVILRHALGLPARRPRAASAAASGVMMLPIPRAGTLARGARPGRRARGPRRRRARDHDRPGPPGGRRSPRATATSASSSPGASTPDGGRGDAARRRTPRLDVVIA